MSLLTLGRDSRNMLWAGLFVLGGLLLFAGWVVVRGGWSWKRQIYYTELTNVTGLDHGAPVMVAGYPIGQVQRIEPIYEGDKVRIQDGEIRFRITLAINQEWSMLAGTQVRLQSPNLLAAPIIMLQLGKAVGPPLPPGRTIAAMEEVDEDLTDRAQSVLGQAEKLLQTLDSTVQQVDNALGSQADDVTDTNNLRAIINQVRSITNHLEGTLQRLSMDLSNQPDTSPQTPVGTLIQDVQTGLANLQSLTQQAQGLVRQTAQLGDAVQTAMTQTQPALTAAATDLEYTLRLMSDQLPIILANLAQGTQELSELLSDLRQQPLSTIRGRSTEEPAWQQAQPRH